MIVVHGGGKEIADLHAQLGVPFETVDGLRVTSEESLRLVEMVLNGSVNTRLVRRLVNGRRGRHRPERRGPGARAGDAAASSTGAAWAAWAR